MARPRAVCSRSTFIFPPLPQPLPITSVCVRCKSFSSVAGSDLFRSLYFVDDPPLASLLFSYPFSRSDPLVESQVFLTLCKNGSSISRNIGEQLRCNSFQDKLPLFVYFPTELSRPLLPYGFITPPTPRRRQQGLIYIVKATSEGDHLYTRKGLIHIELHTK